MKKILSIKSLIIALVATTALYSCQDNKTNVVENPLIFKEQNVSLKLGSTYKIEFTNTNIAGNAEILYSAAPNDTLVKFEQEYIKNAAGTDSTLIMTGNIKAMNVGSTKITAFVKGDYLSTISVTPCEIEVVE